MDSAPIDIPLPSEFPGREPPSPATRQPLNSLICAILDPFRTIEEIAEDRKITVMHLGEILSAEPASSALDTLRKVFALRTELLALHAQVSAVGTLVRITNSGKDDEVARRAATTLLRMFRPDGSRAPLPPDRDRASTDCVPDRAPDRGSARSGSPPPHPTPTTNHAPTPAMSESSSNAAALRSTIAGSFHPTRSSLDDPASPASDRQPTTPIQPTPTTPNIPNQAATVTERPTPHTPARATPPHPTAPTERGGPEGRQPLRTATSNPPPSPPTPATSPAPIIQHAAHASPIQTPPLRAASHHARPPPSAAP